MCGLVDRVQVSQEWSVEVPWATSAYSQNEAVILKVRLKAIEDRKHGRQNKDITKKGVTNFYKTCVLWPSSNLKPLRCN